MSTTHSSNPIQMFQSLLKYRPLIWQLTKREVIGRYKGSMIGLGWSFFNPLIMLAVYTVVFNTIFQGRWIGGTGTKTEFALMLFIGLIMHGVIAETLGRAPSLIIGNVAYVKKIVFPLEALAWIMMGATLFHTVVSLGVWVLFYVLVNQSLNWTIVFMPLLLVPLILFSMGLSWFFSALGVYLRDIKQITTVLTTVLLFMSPVFYPVSRLPEPYRSMMYINPMTYILEESRDVMMWGNLPSFTGLLIIYAVSLLVAWLGFTWFQKTRNGFADVL
jgi:lipopolysaccharide transport system permease protein